MQTFSNILILGVSGGIGSAFSRALRDKFPNASICGTSRNPELVTGLKDVYKLDALEEDDWKNLHQTIEKAGLNFDLIISTIGVLRIGDYGPERSLKTVDLNKITEVFQINAISSVMVGRYLCPFLDKTNNSCVAFLSAMVGSIAENELGGWYSYRASKTALNMLVKNMAIEYSRKRTPVKFLLLHPGTTETEFSKDFLKNVKHTVWQPDSCVNNLLKIICAYESYSSGDFRNWDDRTIAW